MRMSLIVLHCLKTSWNISIQLMLMMQKTISMVQKTMVKGLRGVAAVSRVKERQ